MNVAWKDAPVGIGDRVQRIDPQTWQPPAVLPSPSGERLRGALGGTQLYDRPEHQAFRDAITSFVAVPGPLALEIGFDHGARLLDHARRFPEWRWLGCEIRRARVEAAAPHAPDNALLLRADARTLLAAVIPAGRLAAIYLLFPTPTDHPRHLLLTPDLVALAARALADDGVFHIATDVPGMARWADTLLAGWRVAAPPPMGPVLSRRERVCARDDLPVWRLDRHPPR